MAHSNVDEQESCSWSIFLKSVLVFALFMENHRPQSSRPCRYYLHLVDPRSKEQKQAFVKDQDGGATEGAAVPDAARFPPGGGMNRGRYV